MGDDLEYMPLLLLLLLLAVLLVLLALLSGVLFAPILASASTCVVVKLEAEVVVALAMGTSTAFLVGGVWHRDEESSDDMDMMDAAGLTFCCSLFRGTGDGVLFFFFCFF